MNFLTLAAKLILDGTGFKAGLQEAKAASERFSATVAKDIKNKLSSAFAVGALGYGVKRIIDFNSKLVDTATALDITTDSLQEQNFWLTQNGASADALSGAYKGLAKARQAALEGDEGKLGAFQALGIDKEQLQKSSIEDLFKKSAQAFSQTDFGADNMAMAMQVFGKGAFEIMPALNASLEEFAQKARDSGQIIKGETSAALEAMGDEIDKLAGTAMPILSEVVIAVAAGLGNLLTAVNMLWGGLGTALGHVSGDQAVPELGEKGKKSARMVALNQQLKDEKISGIQAGVDFAAKALERWENLGDAKKVKVKGTAYMTEPEEKEARLKAEREAREPREPADRGDPGRANEVSSLTRTGQLSARDATLTAREPLDKLVDFAKQQLSVEREQAATLKAIEAKRGSTITGHF